tara:strand:+ start:62 stop:2947 length:2886 start_codon:yes stop_codon:yes gene_type:complete
MPPGLLVLLKGEVRLMSLLSNNRSVTLDRRGPGQMMGWISHLRNEPCEMVQASEECICLIVPSSLLRNTWDQNTEFKDFFDSLVSPSEMSYVLSNAFRDFNAAPSDEAEWLKTAFKSTQLINSHPIELLPEYDVLFSGPAIPNGDIKVGQRFSKISTDQYHSIITYTNKSRWVQCPTSLLDPYHRLADNDADNIEESQQQFKNGKLSSWLSDAKPAEDVLSSIASSDELGFVSAEDLDDAQKYVAHTARGLQAQILATLRSLSDTLTLPFPQESLQRIVRQQLKRRSTLSLELLAQLSEGLGLQTRLGKVRIDQVQALEWPTLIMSPSSLGPSRPLLLHGFRDGQLIVADPSKGLTNLRVTDLFNENIDNLRVLIVQKTKVTKVDRFGWRWFTPLLSKYRRGLIIVLLATFGTQLATLGIPLLMQQIIDKTLSQGNISSLNVLGAALISIALFQALMTALRTFVFKDTADRMDLQLGATVIDRLLRLPLPFFDKRPVGELSQRLGEMNSIRGFLTGTAITSLMDLLFSAIYIVVMVLYSPLMTVVALSTFPVYVLLVVVVAPLYKSLIRKQAVAQARTQSHVIEVLSAIQTVKAQNVELMSRWKWQDRYQGVVEEGFKAVTVGTVSGQIGSFLNTLSSLLVLWVGMMQVIDGNLTLGQLIAFRIIAGYVTGPLLRLSNLYQGFQKVSLSFERLGDIINQQPESDTNTGQISLPPVEGDVVYDDLSFRFTSSGPLVLDSVNLHIKSGQFVGVAGLSGSGKSTLMKLLGRLYDPLSGRITVDGYDISKVDLGSLRQQIGIVPQDSLLFEGSVRDNISLGRPEADTDDIIHAAKIACAHDFIMDLPDGYNTKISEKGSNLSGGQRQRLSIARTILSEPRLLVMDEATSALDFQTEAAVCNNLRHELKGRTVFFITHRLGTIRQADSIVLMHQGRLIESGTHDELMDSKGRYYALYRQQESGGLD